MKKSKKILQTVLGVAGALTIGGCAFHPGDNIPGEVYGPPPMDPETEVILETENAESEMPEVEETFDVEANMNVCVYGPPEEFFDPESNEPVEVYGPPEEDWEEP